MISFDRGGFSPSPRLWRLGTVGKTFVAETSLRRVITEIPYEIVSWLGPGGMGEVYRARDTKLHREVASRRCPRLKRLVPPK